MKFIITCFFSCLVWTSTLFAQHQKPQAPAKATSVNPAKKEVQLQRPASVNPQSLRQNEEPVRFEQFSKKITLPNQDGFQSDLKVVKDKKTGLPISISGQAKKLKETSWASPEAAGFAYLNEIKSVLQIKEPGAEFSVRKKQVDKVGKQHLRMQQEYEGIPVFASEVIVHLKDGQVDFFNGRYFPSPDLTTTTPAISDEAAIEVVKTNVQGESTLKALTATELRFVPEGKQFKSKLVIYHLDGKADAEHLAWQITAFPNITDRWEYFVDAIDGSILHKIRNSCKLIHDHQATCSHSAKANPMARPNLESTFEKEDFKLLGKETATATDLNGQNRTINVYSVGSTYYMIDAARNMHNATNASQSNFPDDPKGVIVTLNASNTSPQNSNFVYDHVTSGNNQWNNRTSVSAHHNGGVAYDYFESVHSRNSINGSGGNIISIINVADQNGEDMDNAFWNGAAMFYGNGKQAFDAPLAKALDVAGHEMSHGVIQATANLTYQNQEGALNESFADIFGAMMDRNDWQIGEEVANGSIFPSGTMRDMENPNNGGNSNDFYWQPDHMDDFVNLPNTQNGDFGGVHINSGIPNHAYYLFATAIGKDKAERIFYKALDDYLVASSQFVDLRIGVLKAAGDLYGQAEIDAAASAFDQVGIASGPGGDYEVETEENPGSDLILFADLSTLDVYNPADPGNSSLLSNTGQNSRPSISDDGSFVVFVDDQKRLVGIDIDWTAGNAEEFYLEQSPQTIWRNIVVSKDGSKVAYLYELNGTERDKEVTVYDFNLGTFKTFTLYNPTTSNDGSNTGDVQFCDVMEFDVTGEYLMYDAFNEFSGVGGEDISYWDIGIMKVWSNAANNFDEGTITKIFSGLQENESVGNPTFSKNSPYIIAFDYFAKDNIGNETYVLYGANIEQNEISILDDQIFKLSFPSFAPDDKEILYSDLNNGDDIIIKQGLNADKISGTTDFTGLIADATWAVWFAVGERDLVALNDLEEHMELNVFPNPFNESLTLRFAAEKSGEAQVELLDVLGRQLYTTQLDVYTGANEIQLPDLDLGVGTYTLRLVMEEASAARQVVRVR